MENDPPIPPDVLRLGRVHGITGNSNWPRPNNEDIMLLIQILPEKYSHIYDRVRHTLSNSNIFYSKKHVNCNTSQYLSAFPVI